MYRIASVPEGTPYRIWLWLTHKNGDFDAIFMTEQAAPGQLESHILDRCLNYTSLAFRVGKKKLSVIV